MATQLEKLKVRLPYNEDDFETEYEYENYLISLLEDTESIALEKLYPFLVNRPALPARYYNWQIRACVELNDTYGFKGLKKYSENGLTFEKASDGMLSYSIMSELIPYAGFPEITKEVQDNEHD